jgi:osmotically-inducible protein OsmY
MRKQLYSLALVVALGSGYAFSQNTPQQKDPQNPQGMPQTQQQPSASDQEKTPAASSTGVQSEIQSALQKDPNLANANVNVQVTDKDVVLSGTVPTQDAKDSAEQIAKSHSGGLPVKNHIKVGGKSPGGSSK